MKRKIVSRFITGLILLYAFPLLAQNVAINTTGLPGSPSAILDLRNTAWMGFLPPAFNLGNVNTLSPVPGTGPAGLIVYNMNANITGGFGVGFYYWTGTEWLFLYNTGSNIGSGWSTKGNSGTNPPTNYVGTTDNENFVIRTNDTARITFLSSSLIGVNTAAPVNEMDINGNLTVGSYAGAHAAPPNGQIVSGPIGFGTSTPAASAMVDMTSAASPYMGLLIPRVALTGLSDIVTIPNPVEYMLVFNSTKQCLEWFDGTVWQILQCLGGQPCVGPPGTLGAISGEDSLLINSSGNMFTVPVIPNANIIAYTWSINSTNATITTGQGTTSISLSVNATPTTFTLSCVANNACGLSTVSSVVIQTFSCIVRHKSTAFNYTGSMQYWTVPCNISSITVTAKGAQGGWNSTYSGIGGKGAVMEASFNATQKVYAGVVLAILVGQCPGNFVDYPGGGGGTFVARNISGNNTNDTALIVAGGGGGAYSGTGTGAPITNNGTGPDPGTGGNGAPSFIKQCGAGGGGFLSSGGNDTNGFFGGAGFHQGGAGGCATLNWQNSGEYQCGGYGGGTAADNANVCTPYAGNGGGYSGGSGEALNSNSYIGNAGGSYVIPGATVVVESAGLWTGNGVVIIQY